MLSMIAFAAVIATQPDGGADTRPICQATGPTLVERKEPARALKLNELPNADLYQTVLRKDEHGCDKPAIGRYDIGSAPHGR